MHVCLSCSMAGSVPIRVHLRVRLRVSASHYIHHFSANSNKTKSSVAIAGGRIPCGGRDKSYYGETGRGSCTGIRYVRHHRMSIIMERHEGSKELPLRKINCFLSRSKHIQNRYERNQVYNVQEEEPMYSVFLFSVPAKRYSIHPFLYHTYTYS